MKYIQVIVIRVMLFYSIISMLLLCCTSNTKQTNLAMETENIIVNVLNHSIQDDIVSITLEINNKDSIDYYMIYSYEGDLDTREFPSIEKKENNLIVNYKPFYSEKVSAYYTEHENDDPTIIIPKDEIGVQKIKSKEKRIITLTFTNKSLNVDKLDLLLYFGEYLEKDKLSDEQTFYIPPTKEFYNLFSFKEKLVKIQ